MNGDPTGVQDAVEGLRDELTALRATLQSLERFRVETLRRATSFETRIGAMVAAADRGAAEALECAALMGQLRDELLARLEDLEGRLNRLETESAQTRDFVTRVRALLPFRLRRKLLYRRNG